MSQMPVAHAVQSATQVVVHSAGQSAVSSLHAAASSAHVVAAKLPQPAAKFTVPIIVVFALLALLALVRKLVALASIAIIIVGGFIAYQSGAFNKWVDKGKQVIDQQK